WLASHTPIKEAAILRLFHGNPYVIQMHGECEGRLVLEYLPTTLHQEIILNHRQWRMGDILRLALKAMPAPPCTVKHSTVHGCPRKSERITH
ncbi:hypothetical protein CYMTET_36485, partial [Cymbomonas tetramitiformis]